MKKSRNEISTFEIKEVGLWIACLYSFLISILIEILAIPLFLKCEDSTIFLYIVLSSFVVLFCFIKSRRYDKRKIVLAIDQEGIRIRDKKGRIKSFPWQLIESIDARPILTSNGYTKGYDCFIFVKPKGCEELGVNITPYCFTDRRKDIRRAIIYFTGRNDLFHNNIPPVLKSFFMSKDAIMSYRGK